MVFPFLILLFLFSYLPLYGWVYSFFDYRPPKSLSDCAFVGIDWFRSMVSTPEKRLQLWEVLRNTFVMSGLGLLTSWMPMAFAILLSEIRNRHFKKQCRHLPQFQFHQLGSGLLHGFFPVFNQRHDEHLPSAAGNSVKACAVSAGQYPHMAEHVAVGDSGRDLAGAQSCIWQPYRASTRSCMKQPGLTAPEDSGLSGT